MGYAESYCRICAVTFNLARYRTKYEPADAAWGYCGGEHYADGIDTLCGMSEEAAAQSGCENVDLDSPAEGTHLSGPGCCGEGGYSGHRISVAEMKGMNLPRYIVKKPVNATPPPDEEDYEHDSDYFVTAPSTGPPNDFEMGPLSRVRYGVDFLITQGYRSLDFSPTGIPVHYPCWQIFERVSKLRSGLVDIQGFAALWEREACHCCGFQNLKQDSIIKKCQRQTWSHRPGTEYLAANPVDILDLTHVLHYVLNERYWEEVVFRAQDPEYSKSTPTSAMDPFARLPSELTSLILSHLSSPDIAHLRLASRTFRQLPKSIFRKLVQSEMPWFWEIEALDEKAYRADRTPRTHANWHAVYERLRTLQKGILGVRNRARVWAAAEEIVARIGRLRRKMEVEVGELQVQPTAEERERGEVTSGYSCIGCKDRG